MQAAGLVARQACGRAPWRAVLFDLDGTLVDSAPGLGLAANVLRERRGRSPLPLSDYRAHAGSGARGMLELAFSLRPLDAAYPEMKAEFLDTYEGLMFCRTELFAGVAEQLELLARMGIAWGIATNKAERFALPLVHAMGLRAGALVAGDTTPHTKPHPAPLLECARRLGFSPHDCVYVGDDLRDMQAGQAAGMTTAIAAWGYLGPDARLEEWPADYLLTDPGSILKSLSLT